MIRDSHLTVDPASQPGLDPKRVLRCGTCGKPAYWSSEPVCLPCALKEEEESGEAKRC